MGSRPKVIANWDETFIIWLAGFIDGEGCISLHRWPGCHNLSAHLQILNTNKAVLDYILVMIGHGSICMRKRPSPRHKDAWKYVTYGVVVYNLCKRMLPYLHIKKLPAEIIVEYWEKYERYGLTKKAWNIAPDNEVYLERIHTLNKRGA